ncbi:HNH endonuclease [compost metagenome]
MSGKKFGSRNTHGHVRGGLDGKLFYAHRIVWKMVHGDEPEIIDHLNGNPEDNSITNLRNGSRGDNQRNQKLSRTSTSGVQGVYLHRQSNGWYARINTPAGGKLSFYSKSKEAVEAWRRDREIEFGYSGRASA